MKVKVRPGLWLLVSVVFMMTIGATLFVWSFLRGQETRRAEKVLLSASETLQDRVQAELDQEINSVQRLAAKWQIRPAPTREEWEFDVRQILEDHLSLLSLSWLETESIQYVESMGFMLDNVGFRARDPGEQRTLFDTLPPFREQLARAAGATPMMSSAIAMARPQEGPKPERVALARLLASF